ncbi:MAG: hypothetical protein H7Z41_06600 [Cytophagales bacterium]|nr:hypothetical protein [Armatimonadota bacterium]
MRINRLTFVATLIACSAAAVISGAANDPGSKPDERPRRLSPAARQRLQEKMILLTRAEDARGNGDLVAAETLLRQYEATYGTTESVQSGLAEMLDTRGRIEEALVYYKQLVHNPYAGGGNRSAKNLLRYGALCEQQAELADEARYAYTAILQQQNNAADDFAGIYPKMPWSANESLPTLRARAEIITGMTRGDISQVRDSVHRLNSAEGHLFLGLALLDIPTKVSPLTTKSEAVAELQQAAQSANPEISSAATAAINEDKIPAYNPKHVPLN